MGIQEKNYLNKLKEITSQNITPEEYIAQYIQKNPDKKTAVENALKKIKNPALIAKAIIYKESTPSVGQEFTSSFKEGYYSTMAGLDALMSLINKYVPITSEEGLKERMQKWQTLAEEQSDENVGSILHPKEGITKSLARTAGGLAEFLAEIAATAGIGGLAEGGITKVLGKAALKGAEKEAAEEAGTKILSKALPYATVSGSEMGQQYEAGGEQHPIKAILGGAATGALYTLSPFEALKVAKGANTLTDKITDDLLKLVSKTDIAQKFPEATSGAIESLKQSIEQSAILGTASLTSQWGSNQKINVKQAGEEALLGGVLGAAIGSTKGILGDKRLTQLVQREKTKKEFQDILKEQPKPAPKTTTALVPTQPEAKPIDVGKIPEKVLPSLEKYNDLLHTEIKPKESKDYNPYLHKVAILKAVKDGTFKIENPAKDIKVLKSAGLSDIDILKQFPDQITPKDYTPDMAKALIKGDTDSAKVPINEKTIPELLNRINYFTDKYKTKAFKTASKDLKQEIFQYITDKADKLKKTIKLPENKQEFEINFKISKNEKPESLIKKLEKLEALKQKIQTTEKVAPHIEEIKSEIPEIQRDLVQKLNTIRYQKEKIQEPEITGKAITGKVEKPKIQAPKSEDILLNLESKIQNAEADLNKFKSKYSKYFTQDELDKDVPKTIQTQYMKLKTKLDTYITSKMKLEKSQATIPETKPKTSVPKELPEPEILNDYSFKYDTKTKNYKIKVVRAGAKTSDISRGGTWYEVELYKGKKPSSTYLNNIHSTVGGKEIHRGEVNLKKPYFFNVPPDIKSEAEIPLSLYKEVTGKSIKAKSEKTFAKIEKEISDTLSKKGYDGIVFYYGKNHNIGKPYAAQVFKFETKKEPFTKTIYKSLKVPKKTEKWLKDITNVKNTENNYMAAINGKYLYARDGNSKVLFKINLGKDHKIKSDIWLKDTNYFKKNAKEIKELAYTEVPSKYDNTQNIKAIDKFVKKYVNKTEKPIELAEIPVHYKKEFDIIKEHENGKIPSTYLKGDVIYIKGKNIEAYLPAKEFKYKELSTKKEPSTDLTYIKKVLNNLRNSTMYIKKGNKIKGITLTETGTEVKYNITNDKITAHDLETLEKYKEQAGLISQKISESKLKKVYETRKEIQEKGLNEENAKKLAKLLDAIAQDLKPEEDITLKLSADEKKVLHDYHNTFEVSKNILDKIFGKQAEKINLKSISNPTLEDFGGREALLKTFKEDYNRDLSKLSDEELLKEAQKTIKGFVRFEPDDKATIVVLAKHIDDNIAFTFYHELFHVLSKYEYLSKDEVEALKKYAEQKYPNDYRNWEEKIADDFAYYTITKYKPPSLIETIYRKIKSFFNRLKLRFGKKINPETLYQDILDGKYQHNIAYIYKRMKTLSKPEIKLSANAGVVDKFGYKLKEYSGRNEDTFLNYARHITFDSLKSAKDFLASFFKGATPETAKPKTALENEVLRRFVSLRAISTQKTLRKMGEIFKGLTPEDKDLMEKYLIASDMKYALDNGIQTFDHIKQQWDNIFEKKEDIDTIYNTFKERVDKNKKVQEALKKRRKAYDDIIEFLAERGFIGDPSKLNSEVYFHRITLDYFNGKNIRLHTSYLGKIPKTDPLIERTNAVSPYLTDLIYSDYEALTQFHILQEYANGLEDLQIATKDKATTMKNIYADYLISKKKEVKIPPLEQLIEHIKHNPILAKRFEEETGESIKDFHVLKIEDIPHFYSVFTVPNDLAHAILNNENISPDLLKEKFTIKPAIQKYKQEVLIRQEVIKAMRRIFEQHTPKPIEKFMQSNISLFKKMVLFFPARFFKYSFGNFTSDIDISLALSPKIVFKYAPQASKDLYQYFYNKDKLDAKTREEIETAFNKMVLGTNLTTTEIAKIDTFDEFKNIMGTKPPIYQNPVTAVSAKWFNWAYKFNDFRESILRLAAYRHYKEKLAKKPLEQVYSVIDLDYAKALKEKGYTNDDIAALMARKGIGDYGDISPAGQFLRKNLIPFWSWIEINFSRYAHLFKTLYKQRNYLGGTLVTARLAARMAIMYAAVVTWNELMFPKENAEINNRQAGNLRLILGHNSNGDVISLNIMGSFFDLFGYFFENDPYTLYKKIHTGETKPLDIIKGIPKTFVNQLANAAMPIKKTALELALGESFFPDISNPRPIRDKTKHFLSLFGMGMPYQILFSGTPKRETERTFLGKLSQVVEQSLFYFYNPDEINYYNEKQDESNFLKEIGVETPPIGVTEKSNYAYWFKKSLEYGDKESAIRFLAQYYALGGTIKSLQKSLKASEPLSSIPKAKLKQYLESLTPEQKERLKKAQEWYRRVYYNYSKFNRKEIVDIYNQAYRLYISMKRKKK